ncbi:class I SAM-dependent methyltransferase [Paraglaciecola sp. 2405UD69-4]|uniref:class I SAM-dependent methyltransferase n=1 Tax=Paraglaciecola sp. 2405UD69-4 TaxID=3391836 RepID=UPI0039C97BFC
MKTKKTAFDIPPPITAATNHGVYPELNHDERARMNFLSACYRVVASTIAPGNKKAYETQVLPKFKAEHNREPESRHEVRSAMNQNAFHNCWGATRRNLMEIRQQTGRAIVLRQAEALSKRAALLNKDSDNLSLNPNLSIPPYVANVDHHCMPGSYYTELVEGDVMPAANYDAGFFVTTGGTIGGLCDGAGKAIANWVKSEAKGFSPKRILDIGVAAGHSLVPIAQAFPDAEIVAIDVSAPMLRYAHARAKSLGVNNIKFIQMSGEDMSKLSDQSFDWVQTSIFLHELSARSLPKILKEAYRVLKPGGLTLHLEQPQYEESMPLFEQFMRDWDAYNNNEPFWTAMHAIDMKQALVDSGLQAENLFHAAMRGVIDTKLFAESRLGEEEDYGRSAAWHAYGAWKE